MKMRRYIIYSVAASTLLGAAFSCSKDTVGSVTMEPCAFRAAFAAPQDSTKTHIGSISGDKAAIYWNDGDAISLIPTDGVGGNCQMTAASGGVTAEFSGDVTEGTTNFVAVYPYTSGAAYSGGIVSGFSIPATQTATQNSFANGASISLAVGSKTIGNPDAGTMEFKNLCSVIGFTLPSNITFAEQVVVSAKSGANIAGDVSINASTPAITSASAASVTVNGTFEGGNTYYICIAPGTYTDGFNFAISTKDGNSYTRSTSKTLTAEKGKIYPLGKLSLEIPAGCFSPKVVVTHTLDGTVLTGSTAVFSMTSDVPDEFDSAIKSILTTVAVTKNSKTYRTCAGAGKNIDETEMTKSDGCPYIPGGCTYKATIIYTINNGVKDVARTITKDCEVTWSAPGGFSITATPTGYTSYSCYTGADGQSKSVSNANSCDNATIYGVGPVYVSGLSSEVKSQSDSEGLLTFTTAVTNQSAVSGKKSGETWNLTGQNWQAYTISVTGWTFDTASGSCSNSNKSKTVYVTGLPYNKDNAYVYDYRRDDWSWTKNGSWKDKEYLNWYLATVNFKGFYIPTDIPATVNYSFENYSGSSFHTYLKCYAGNTQFLDVDNQASAKWYDYNGTANVTFTSSQNTITCVNSAKSSWASSAVATSRLYKMQVLYR